MRLYEISCNYEAPQTWWENGGTQLYEWWRQKAHRADRTNGEDFSLDINELAVFLSRATDIEGWPKKGIYIEEELAQPDCPIHVRILD